MISDLDIYRSANVLIRLHGEDTPSKPPSVERPLLGAKRTSEHLKIARAARPAGERKMLKLTGW